jgi:hypothetical protein
LDWREFEKINFNNTGVGGPLKKLSLGMYAKSMGGGVFKIYFLNTFNNFRT